jgi:pyruvate dehydrogenase kinase 2/3/4
VRSRISRRVITEQHIALTSQFRDRQHNSSLERQAEDERVGVVDTKINAAKVTKRCTDLVKLRGGLEAEIPVIVEGEVEECFAYIPEHLE